MSEIPLKRTVFLVDDHPLVCEGLATMINRQGDMTVCGQASTASEALRAIEALRPDAVIVDITLERGSGLELIKDVKATFPECVMLVLSMHEESDYAQRALLAGARGYVMKREAAKKVILALRDVLAGKLFVSEAFARETTEKVFGSSNPVGMHPLLSDRELEVFEMLGQGYETRRVAESLNLSMKTVQTYCARIKEKLRLDTAHELMREAVRWVSRKEAG